MTMFRPHSRIVQSGRSRMNVFGLSVRILQDVAEWFPGELNLALRAYGNSSASELNDCSDSQLLVGFGEKNRGQIREAVTELSPLGQTPLAYALNQVGEDFAQVSGERAVVLVTDGIESCGGDPVAAAQALSEQELKRFAALFGHVMAHPFQNNTNAHHQKTNVAVREVGGEE